jgi:co-chaperonin GroES (HSP10)
MTKYVPEPGNALVRLIPKYGGIKIPGKSYDTLRTGEILLVGTKNKDYLIGTIGFWRDYKDDLRFENETLAFIELKDILGYSTKE